MASEEREFVLDWAASGMWVQDRSLYLVPDEQPGAGGEICVTDQMGNTRQVDRKTFEATHQPVRNATVYKAIYAPVQAFCPPEDMHVRMADGTVHPVPAGDALMRDADGTVHILDRHTFNCRFQFVAAGGDRAPFT